MSGFFLDDKTFLTCAHFNPQQGAKEEMKAQKNGLVAIGRDRKPFGKHSLTLSIRTSVILISFSLGSNPKNVRAHLIHHDVERDYAVFRLDDEQPLSEAFLGPESIVALDPPRMQNLIDYGLFTIGYNQDAFRADWAKCAKHYSAMLSPTEKGDMEAKKPGTLEMVSN